LKWNAQIRNALYTWTTKCHPPISSHVRTGKKISNTTTTTIINQIID